MFDSSVITGSPLVPQSPRLPAQPRAYSIPVYRIALVKEETLRQTEQPQMDSSANVAKILHEYLDGSDREHFVVLLLNCKNKVIGINTVSTGSLTSSLAHPREVFKAAILGNAAAVILGHNHPSGDPTPSSDDVNLTKRLCECGELLGIKVLDHIVLGESAFGADRLRYVSFVDDGYWNK